jgi:hypothetical protein
VANNGIANIPKGNKVRRKLVAKNGIANIPKDNKVRRRLAAAANLNLSRHANEWMFWSSNALYLAWLGFSDVHSGVEYYKVTVGSSYMASNLCKVRYISSLLQYSGPLL